MERPHLRPQFKRVLDVPACALLDALIARLRQPRSRIVGRVTRRHAHLTVHPREQHLWSPHLSLDLLSEDDAHPNRIVLRGRYAPHPSVWTAIMGIYGVLLMVGLGGGVFGWSQVLLKEEPNALWVIPIAMVIAALLYLFALVGQRIAQKQMHVLQDFLEACLDEAANASSSIEQVDAQPIAAGS